MSGYIIQNLRPDYLEIEYFCEYDPNGARGVFSWHLVCSHLFPTRADAAAELKKLKNLQKKNPKWWHKAKSKGGYGLDKMSIYKPSEAEAKRIREFHQARASYQHELDMRRIRMEAKALEKPGSFELKKLMDEMNTPEHRAKIMAEVMEHGKRHR